MTAVHPAFVTDGKSSVLRIENQDIVFLITFTHNPVTAVVILSKQRRPALSKQLFSEG